MSFIQIGSLNVEHLSGVNKRKYPQSAYALADHIEMAGIDVLALQEIYVTPTDEQVRLRSGQPPIDIRTLGERRNSDLDKVCYLLEEHAAGKWMYLILPNRRAGDNSQLCAVMWNTEKVEQTDVFTLNVTHDSNEGKLWDRTPHAVTFTSSMDVWDNSSGQWQQVEANKSFTVIPLHMKSNYRSVTKSRRKRAKEAETLIEAVTEAQAAGAIDPSIIMIGDTNVLNNEEGAIETVVSGGFTDLNNTDSSTYWSREYGDSPFDRAFVADDRKEFKYSRQYVLRSADLQLHDRFLSDHYMIKVSINLYHDDSDPR